MAVTTIIDVAYLIGAILFVLGLRLLSSPDTARKGNIYAAVGMAIGIVSTLGDPRIEGNNNYLWIAAGMVVGAAIGWLAAKKIRMTAMPQMVSVFNGLGGACAAVLSMVEMTTNQTMEAGPELIALSALLIGSI